MTGYIYIIRNIKNNKVYIGQTSRTVKARWEQHKAAALRNEEQGVILYRAMRKYGVHCFYVDTLEECDINDLNDREKYWISKYNSHTPNGYNVREGGEDPGRKPVYKINPITNEIIKYYSSAMFAAEENNIDLSHLTKVCRRQEKSSKGFKWSYVENYDQNYLSSINVKKQNYPIYQMDNETGQLIKKWDSIAEASTALSIDQPSISKCLTGRYKTAGGFGWCDDTTINGFIPYQKNKKIIQYDNNFNVIKIWNSAKEASEALNISASAIYAVCKGKHKTYKKYIWKYDE